VNVHWWPARSSALYWRSPKGISVGSMSMRAPPARARSQCARASSTRAMTEWVTSPGRGGATVTSHVGHNHRTVAETEL
jgi:hypothetical protein